MSNSRDLNRLKKIAEEANKYVSKIILKSNTTLEMNDLPNAQREAIFEGIEDVRELGLSCDPESGIENEFIAKLRNKLFISEKYSFGNCHEMAIHAGIFIHKNYPWVYLNLYKIKYKYNKEATHHFLILSDKPLIQENIELLNGVVCDPWMKDFYPTSQYASKLKCHCFIESNEVNLDINQVLTSKNSVIPFNTNDFYFKSVPGYNTDYLNTFMCGTALRNNLLEKLDNISSTCLSIKREIDTYYYIDKSATGKMSYLNNEVFLKVLDQIEIAHNAIKKLKKDCNAICDKDYESALKTGNAIHQKALSFKQQVDDRYFLALTLFSSIQQIKKRQIYHFTNEHNESLKQKIVDYGNIQINELKKISNRLNHVSFTEEKFSKFKTQLEFAVESLEILKIAYCHDVSFIDLDSANAKVLIFKEKVEKLMQPLLETFNSIKKHYQLDKKTSNYFSSIHQYFHFFSTDTSKAIETNQHRFNIS